MSPDIQRAIAERARTQLGLVTTAQVAEIGAASDLARRLTAAGRLERVGRRTLRVAGAPTSHAQQVLAACLDTGGAASHRTAAVLHGLHGFPAGPIEVTVGRALHHGRHPLATIHTSTNLPTDDLVRVGPIPVTGVARTFLGLAALVPLVPEETIRTALGAAARDGLVSDAWLWWRLERLRCRGRNGVATMERILRDRVSLGPTESWLEQRFLELLAEHGLPTPEVQRRVRHRGSFVARVDLAFAPARLAIELEGYAHHSTREDRSRDERRRNRLILAGWTVMVFTYDQVVRDPQEVVATVRAALAARHVD